jgi:hypothetical protein
LIHKDGCAERMTIADDVLLALAVKVDDMRSRAHGQLHG